MRVEILNSILLSIEPTVADSTTVRWLRTTLEPVASAQLKAVIRQLPLGEKVENGSGELFRAATIVTMLSTVLLHGGSRSAADELRSFSEALRACDLDRGAFEAEIKQGSVKTLKAKKAEVDAHLVRRYVHLLLDSQASNDAFDRVVAQLKTDKKARVAELRAIASEFVGYTVTGKGKADFVRRIVDRQALDSRHDAKSSAVSF